MFRVGRPVPATASNAKSRPKKNSLGEPWKEINLSPSFKFMPLDQAAALFDEEVVDKEHQTKNAETFEDLPLHRQLPLDLVDTVKKVLKDEIFTDEIVEKIAHVNLRDMTKDRLRLSQSDRDKLFTKAEHIYLSEADKKERIRNEEKAAWERLSSYAKRNILENERRAFIQHLKSVVFAGAILFVKQKIDTTEYPSNAKHIPLLNLIYNPDNSVVFKNCDKALGVTATNQMDEKSRNMALNLFKNYLLAHNKLRAAAVKTCDLLLMATPPQADNLEKIPGASRTAYVITGDQVYFVDKDKKDIVLVKKIEPVKDKDTVKSFKLSLAKELKLENSTGSSDKSIKRLKSKVDVCYSAVHGTYESERDKINFIRDLEYRIANSKIGETKRRLINSVVDYQKEISQLKLKREEIKREMKKLKGEIAKQEVQLEQARSQEMELSAKDQGTKLLAVNLKENEMWVMSVMTGHSPKQVEMTNDLLVFPNVGPEALEKRKDLKEGYSAQTIAREITDFRSETHVATSSAPSNKEIYKDNSHKITVSNTAINHPHLKHVEPPRQETRKNGTAEVRAHADLYNILALEDKTATDEFLRTQIDLQTPQQKTSYDTYKPGIYAHAKFLDDKGPGPSIVGMMGRDDEARARQRAIIRKDDDVNPGKKYDLEPAVREKHLSLRKAKTTVRQVELGPERNKNVEELKKIFLPTPSQTSGGIFPSGIVTQPNNFRFTDPKWKYEVDPDVKTKCPRIAPTRLFDRQNWRLVKMEQQQQQAQSTSAAEADATKKFGM